MIILDYSVGIGAVLACVYAVGWLVLVVALRRGQ